MIGTVYIQHLTKSYAKYDMHVSNINSLYSSNHNSVYYQASVCAVKDSDVTHHILLVTLTGKDTGIISNTRIDKVVENT